MFRKISKTGKNSFMKIGHLPCNYVYNILPFDSGEIGKLKSANSFFYDVMFSKAIEMFYFLCNYSLFKKCKFENQRF